MNKVNIQIGSFVMNMLESVCLVYTPSRHTFPVPSANKANKRHISSLPGNVQVNKHTRDIETVQVNNDKPLPSNVDSEWTKDSVYRLPCIPGRSEDLTEEEIKYIELNNRQGKETLVIAKAVTIKRLWARGLKNEEISMVLGKGFSLATVGKYTPLFNRGEG